MINSHSKKLKMIVFAVLHTHEKGDGEEDVKMIGVYASEMKAKNAVKRLKTKPGFCDSPSGFSITKYTVDKDHWTDGYVTRCYTVKK